MLHNPGEPAHVVSRVAHHTWPIEEPLPSSHQSRHLTHAGESSPHMYVVDMESAPSQLADGAQDGVGVF